MDAPISWIQEQVIDAATVNLQQRVVERGVHVWSISGVGVAFFSFACIVCGFVLFVVSFVKFCGC